MLIEVCPENKFSKLYSYSYTFLLVAIFMEVIVESQAILRDAIELVCTLCSVSPSSVLFY